MDKKKDVKPYIADNQILPEMTATSVITGILLAVIFGVANAYLGLRVGMTVSASVPAAVVSMGVLRVILKKNSILESNIVQTIGSAGESVAAGAIFTIPALFLWAKEGLISLPSALEITLIALLGGLLGVFFMVPLRRALIVKEHNVLPYPEGRACAEVLLAGETGKNQSSVVFSGMGVGALLKFIIDGLKAVPGEIIFKIKGYSGEAGMQIYPAVLGVGYICGPKIASYMFSGGVLSWLVLIPLIIMFGGDSVFYPGSETIAVLYENGGASAIWSTYIRYIGAGALATGGIISLIKNVPLICNTFIDTFFDIKKTNGEENSRTNDNISMKTVLISILCLIVLVWLVPAIPVSLVGALVVAVFGFFFGTVSSRMVGLVGSSNNPVSGMSIATLLFATFILKIFGQTGNEGMASAIAIGSIICIITAVASDTSQDLKTGYLLGATPKKQQIGEIIGVIFAALSIGGTMYLLDAAWGFGSKELAAPQATLMKLIVEGVMDANLPWTLVFSGAFIAITAEILKIPVLAFAIGIYLPIHLNACIMIGGIIRYAIEKRKGDKEKKESEVKKGLLFCSGLIAGEGITGVLLAIIAVLGLSSYIDISGATKGMFLFGEMGSLLLFILLILAVVLTSLKKKER